MMARTPEKLAGLARVYGEMRRQQLHTKLQYWSSHREEWRVVVGTINEGNPAEQQVDPERDPLTIDPIPERFDVIVDPREMIPMALHIGLQSVPIFLRMGWAFFRSEGTAFFVTSDNPFVALDPLTGSFDTGIRLPQTEISLPVGRNQFFLGTWKWKGTQWRLATTDFVHEMNRRTVARATTLFAPKTVFPASDVLVTPAGGS